MNEPFPHRERKLGVRIDTIVMHATGTEDAAECLAVLRERGLSYHFLIDRDGTVTELVPPDRAAHHAGESVGPQGPVCNEYTIGLSFVNHNDGDDPYLPIQTERAIEVILALKAKFPLRWLTSHAIIAPTRKVDPKGYDLFPLAEAVGLEVWQPIGQNEP